MGHLFHEVLASHVFYKCESLIYNET